MVVVRNDCVVDGQPSPCVNGYCVDGTNAYFCQCFDGFTGTNCDREGKIVEKCRIMTIPLYLLTVTVRSPPMFVARPSQESVQLGETANFSCITTGEPRPSITWSMNGETIPGEVTPYLIIASTATADRGVYACQATNSEGTITSDEALLRLES